MNIFSDAKTNQAAQLWIVARYLESLSLLIAFFFIKRKLKEHLVFFTYLVGTILLLLAILVLPVFPDCFIEDAGLTAFKKNSEYLICLLLAGSFFLLYKNRLWFDAGILWFLKSAILFSICAELAFTFYISAYGLSNLLGHFFKIISFYCIYKAVIEIGLTQPYNLLFKELSEYKDELENQVSQRTTELQQFECIVSSSHDMMALLNKDFVYLAANDAYLKAFGKSHDEIVGYSVSKIFGIEFFEKIIKPNAEKCLTGNKVRYSEWFDFPARGHQYMDIEYSPYWDHDKKIKGFVVIGRDITDRQKMEEQLLQTQKMESVGVLAGGVAHDFNNILSVIIGNADFALMDTQTNDSIREMIKEIKTAGKRGADLTRQLLAFSRKQIIQPKNLNLNKLFAGIEKMLGRLIGENIEIFKVVEPDLWQVSIDPGQMEQVIMNLAINARDSMSHGGKLTIETANKNLDKNYFSRHGMEEQTGPYVMLAVSDTGIGMDKEIQNHIFDPFYTTKERDKGTGLGLATVYGIVKQNNGFIWVYSEPGQGAAFKIYLPKVDQVNVPEETKQPVERNYGGTETILIVEDDDSLRKLARSMLKRNGYKVIEAGNGEEALKTAKQHDEQIDLLLTDVIMPKMGGKKTAEQLQTIQPQIKIIFMSGYTDDAIVHHGVLEAGLNFLQKPFLSKDLMHIVREVLDNK